MYKNITTTPDTRPDLGYNKSKGKIVTSLVLRVSCPSCGLLDKVRAGDIARLQHLDRAHARCGTHR
jgi:hypothetical protein